MTKEEAITLLEQSEAALRETRYALESDDLARAGKHFQHALVVLDDTCAIQLDALT